MSAPGRPKGEYRSAQHEGTPVSAHGRSKALTAERAARRDSPVDALVGRGGAGAAALPLFLAFAFTYFFSALLRAVTATLAPAFSAELGLHAGDLGLLAGAYFFGFAAMQLPLGRALDRYGPRRTIVVLVTVASLGCAAFALARGLPALIGARALIGVGVGACLMAPLTCFRRVLPPGAQLRANSWMLMTGSLGMVASTVPVQWLLPQVGWRGLFWIVAGCLLVAVALLLALVPKDPPAPPARAAAAGEGSYRAIVGHPLFRRMAPLGFFLYGGMIAVQSLWAGPWLTRVGGATPAESAQGLFTINLCMLFTFLGWGVLMPHLARRGLNAVRLMTWGVPVNLALLALNIALGAAAGPWHWALWCVTSTCVSLSQPAVGQAFPAAQAGRALSAFNLVIFGGVFCLQWGIGLAVDALAAAGLEPAMALRVAFALFGAGCAGAYAAFVWQGRVRVDNGL
jgi:predicted MFS family arabinose efflux permease